jgi:uncharacterized protein YggU (UPF0235/DUF167 family)
MEGLMVRVSATPLLVMVVSVVLIASAQADSGKDLVKVCSQSASLCNSDFESDQLAPLLKANACMPADAGKAQADIVAWLGKHPKTAAHEITVSVKAASRALWPCKK